MTPEWGQWLRLAAVVVATASMTASAHATAVISGDYYQEGSNRRSVNPPASSNCSNTPDCYILFNLIPSGRQMVVTRVSCWFQVTGAAANIMTQVALRTVSTTGQLTDRYSFLDLKVIKDLGASGIIYSAGGATEHVLKAGERPVAYFAALDPGNYFGMCSISGRIGNPPD